MRADASAYTLVAEPTLAATLSLLAAGTHTPMAGGTELMVAFNAGRLAPHPLLSIAHLRELRFINPQPDAITIGGGTTFADLRRSAAIAEAFPLLAQAASWTGSVANQNRATVAGNLCNASPAADSPPALLLYEPELCLVSAPGSRTLPLTQFFLGYKKTAIRPDELLFSVRIPRVPVGFRGSLRKVGTRQAQAISKIALGVLIRAEGEMLREVRLAAASLSAIPMRLRATEAALAGRRLTSETLIEARRALRSEIAPIDDIRSTAAYRAQVAANLLEHALRAEMDVPLSQ